MLVVLVGVLESESWDESESLDVCRANCLLAMVVLKKLVNAIASSDVLLLQDRSLSDGSLSSGLVSSSVVALMRVVLLVLVSLS